MFNIMPKEKNIELRFFKINYQHNFDYYTGKISPKQNFQNKLLNFFKNQNKKNIHFKYKGKEYQLCHIKVNEKKFIFGKLWKLKKKRGKDFPWNEKEKDYNIKPRVTDDFNFNYFYISLTTNHLVIQNQRGFSSKFCIQLMSNWFDKIMSMKEGIIFQSLKDKTKFINQLKEAYKITYAKFTVYPSNHDWEFISQSLDEELKKKKISKLTQEVESNQGMIFDTEKENILSAPLAQSLRGNGENPVIKIEDKEGNISIISNKIRVIRRQIKEMDKMKDSLKYHLKLLLKDYGENEKD